MVVPAHNEADRIARTLFSLTKQSLLPDQIIVVDDNSTDKTDAIAGTVLRGWYSGRVKIVTAIGGSKAKAQNAALPYVDTKYVVAIDADTVLARDALEKLVDTMEKSKAVGACSWVIPINQQSIWTRGRTIEYMFAFTWFKRVQSYIGRPLIISGCFNIFKTKTLKWLGGYPEGTLAEDMDLTSKIYELGIGKGVFSKDAVAYTDDPTTFKDLRNQLERWSCAYFQNIRKHLKSLWKKDKKSAAIMNIGLVDGIIGSTFYPAVIAVGYFWGTLAGLSFLLADAITILAVSMYGARRFKFGLSIATYLPSFFVLRIVNTYYFLKWFVLTGIFGRSIGKYIMGH